MAARNRGSITDCITQEEIKFQYEPTFDLKETTAYGTQKIIGRRLVNKVWVGTGTSELSIEFTLVGPGHTRLMPTPSEIGEERYRKAVAANVERKEVWVPDKVNELGDVIQRGHYMPNPNYNPKYIAVAVDPQDPKTILVENPDYVDPKGTVDSTRYDMMAKKEEENLTVLRQLAKFHVFLEPQSDTGAPHPIYINMGGTYKGRKFIVHAMDSKITVTNYATLDPTEAVVKLSLSEIPAVIKKPELVTASAVMSGKGPSSSGKAKKLPSMSQCHVSPSKTKSRRK